MAALLEFMDSTAMLSYIDLPELSSDSSDGSVEYFAGGQSDLDVHDYMQFEDGQLLDDSCFIFAQELQQPEPANKVTKGNAGERRNEVNEMKGAEGKRRKAEAEFRIGFKTKSDVEIMDDGFKWRKYGKKAVKNSPNPRNYYRCASSGCGVKKRVERDRNDNRYVITIYEGTHNHESPDAGSNQFVPYELANSSNWASCGEMFPNNTARSFTYSIQFAPPSYN